MLPTKVMYFKNSCVRLPNTYFFIRGSCENVNSEEYFLHMFNEEEFGRFLQSFFFSFRTSTIMVFLWDFIFFQTWAFWNHRDAVLWRGTPSLWLLESENMLETSFFFISHLSSVVVWVVFILPNLCWQHRQQWEQGDSEQGMWWTLLSGFNLQ